MIVDEIYAFFHSTTRRLVQYSVARKNVLVCATTICPTTNAEMSSTACKRVSEYNRKNNFEYRSRESESNT